MKKLSLLLLYLLLCNISPVFAHTDNSTIPAASTPVPPAVVPCAYEWCGALWPPPEGLDRTTGKDNCGNTCIKIIKPAAISTGTVWRVEYAKGDYVYHSDIKADSVDTISTFLVFKDAGVEVARFSSKYVIGYVLVQP